MELKLSQIPRKYWPKFISLIADVVGEEAAIELFLRFKGRHLAVPMACPPDHIIAQTIGAEKAALLCRRFSRETICIPKGANLSREIRNQNILADFLSGMNVCDIATKYDMTARNVSNITNQTKLNKKLWLKNS